MSTIVLMNNEIGSLKEFLEELKWIYGVEGYKIIEKGTKENPDREMLYYGLELETEETPKSTFVMLRDSFDQIIESEVMSVAMFLPEQVQDIRIDKNDYTNAVITIEFVSGSTVIIEATEDMLPRVLN